MARKFFTSRAKTKMFSRHVFRSMETRNYGA
ncbi:MULTISPECIES: DUF1661 domain-containing protein [Porphyromonas]|nr:MULTISPECIES: DUF1661 domain-containing protein [Porphyromonas]